MLIYQIDELAIFLVAVFTLRASRLEEKHGRILKLVGGLLMLTLAVVMLVNPALMNNLTSSLIIFGVAFVAAVVVLVLHRFVLPRLGIYMLDAAPGSDEEAKWAHRMGLLHICHISPDQRLQQQMINTVKSIFKGRRQ